MLQEGDLITALYSTTTRSSKELEMLCNLLSAITFICPRYNIYMSKNIVPSLLLPSSDIKVMPTYVIY
ncbi:hypothetical protein PVAP13_2KG345502 [Panicum virgatum]|uniref:Uncharacterized protein n=1 Tax=Panicum virgatum TaxID=38727 RepID=A0A8T0WE43_PANVG|nr:hypothetical protein PVAP13_2KG345502 [Panicum virgatum]